jgi:hypothetical protein
VKEVTCGWVQIPFVFVSFERVLAFVLHVPDELALFASIQRDLQ